ncbi:MAG TPA: FkbM family methyltransferase, partial [Marinagarivorans sp.]
KPYPNITPIQAALWHKNEEIELLDPGLGSWGFMTGQKPSPDQASSTARHKVLGMTVDSLMVQFQLERIDILKIDIEGAEKEVFSDTSEWLPKVDAMIVELHERMKAGCNRSFYAGSQGFDNEWTLGENVYLSRSDYLSPA